MLLIEMNWWKSLAEYGQILGLLIDVNNIG